MGHTPEKEGPTPDAATHWLSLSERGWLNSRERRGLDDICFSEEGEGLFTTGNERLFAMFGQDAEYMPTA